MATTESILGIYMSVRGALARAVVGIVPPKEIEDIVQETYVRACQIEKSKEIMEPRSYLFKTARNLALDHVKKAESRLTSSVEDIGEMGHLRTGQLDDDETFETVATNQEFSEFCEAVRQLPVQCRRAFVMKKVYGYTQREIAVLMNVSESTVEKHIAQGIKRCTYFMMQQGSQRTKNERSSETIQKRKRIAPMQKDCP